MSSTTRWVLCYDSSVTKRGFRGLELTSPIVTTSSQLNELKQILGVFDSYGCEINKTCGLHIHLGDHDATSAQRFKLIYKLNERHLDSVVSYSRGASNCHYSRVCSDSTSIKYEKVSLRNVRSNGSLEIRHHRGTTSYEKVTAWIELMYGISRRSALSQDSIAAYPSLTHMLQDLNISDITKTFLKGRVVQLRSNRR